MPYEWIELALAHTESASIRRHRLPAEQGVWLVIGLALYRHRSIRQVVAELDLALADDIDRCVTIGNHPLARLAHHPALPWQEMRSFMAELRGRKGIAVRALEFTILTAARSGEVIHATWTSDSMTAAIGNFGGRYRTMTISTARI